VGSSICLASSVGCAEGAGGSPCRPVVEMDLLPSRRLRLSNSCPSFPVGRMAGTWEEGHTPVRVWYERGVCVVSICGGGWGGRGTLGGGDRWEIAFGHREICCCLLLRTYMKAVRGGGVKRGDVCYGMLRAAACVDESDHHALMYVWHGQTVREASARRP